MTTPNNPPPDLTVMTKIDTTNGDLIIEGVRPGMSFENIGSGRLVLHAPRGSVELLPGEHIDFDDEVLVCEPYWWWWSPSEPAKCPHGTNETCNKCKSRNSSHELIRGGIGEYLCCECYVNDGNPPADWHIDCMAAYERRQSKCPHGFTKDGNPCLYCVCDTPENEAAFLDGTHLVAHDRDAWMAQWRQNNESTEPNHVVAAR